MCKIKEIKNSLVDYLYTNLETFSICDMGEIIDMVKDLEQTIYYKTLVEAMEDESYTPEEKVQIIKAATE